MADNDLQQPQQDPMLAAFQARAQAGAQGKPAWKPQQGDPTHHIQIGDDHYQVHSDDLQEVQRRVPNVIVHGQMTSGDPMLDAFAARKRAKEAGVPTAATKPGAYQQTKEQAQAHIVHNVNEDAANPFSDTTTSVIGSTGAMMKRPDETDAQFLAAHVKPGETSRQPKLLRKPRRTSGSLRRPRRLRQQRGQLCCPWKLVRHGH